MPLTPADVHNVVFKKPPIGKRGYDEDEVDAFLDVVEAELARLIEENNELRAGSSTGRVTAQPVAAEPAPAPAPPPQPAVREDDTTRASRMLALASETADRYVNEAKMRADSMINDARTRADAMEREARAKAAALDQDAERRHREVMGPLEEKRAGLERKIEELRTFEREYRTRFRSYLESHLRDLDSRGSAEPSSASRQNQHAPA